MPTLYTRSSQLVVAAGSAELKKIPEMYVVHWKECHDLLTCSVMRAREEGFDLSFIATDDLGYSQSLYQERSKSEGYLLYRKLSLMMNDVTIVNE